MSKKKLVLINFIIWPVALVLIFFNSYAVRIYYQLINGDAFLLNNIEYTVSSSAFIIGPTDSGNIGLGYVQNNELASLYLQSGSLGEIDELENIFSSDLKAINKDGCKFLLNNTNSNLPYLSWAKGNLSIYFTITDNPEFDVDLGKLCNVVIQ
ncbi:hypothetical protein J6I90_01315 [Pseudidiomarina sp. 1APP75-32.1]|uniref:Uncharacterized protein n=1 Tax=Pseudidiomarina terrestris TaxID=2820060 RepID=A0AAW7QXE8_9GAMM|nr:MULTISPECIES: hypothetical protein [unclassified Pseudidiomarina]MDN7123510.1 hypothetical protein [Pseudidiomarina sp. 1APP75-32.1]MDN7126700.1 hypothetical protein [Pseudidiomarina sp. 1APR75-33.1]MDN7137646.1 hypothetical protein [Pseudidiomarina sp. 1ASP75-14]